MSLRQLAELRLPMAYSGAEWEEPEDILRRKHGGVLARWARSARAAEADDRATISIYEPIGESWDGSGVTAKRVAGALRQIGAQPVAVNINSGGGDLFEGLSIYNLLREHPAEVTVRVVGLAASAASVIAMAGDRIEVGRAAMLMIHKAWGLVIGNADDMRRAADDFSDFDDLMAGVYAARSKQSAEQVAEWMTAETWFGGEKAVEAGLADALLPADQVEEKAAAAAQDRAPNAALRRIDVALAKDGVSRRERRALLADLGTPSAAEPRELAGSQTVTPPADNVTPRADDWTAATPEMGRLMQAFTI
jgi:ATP-dependent protease ClpP protease subunit